MIVDDSTNFFGQCLQNKNCCVYLTVPSDTSESRKKLMCKASLSFILFFFWMIDNNNF